MAIKLIANYSKRLGLPSYSSHQFSVSVETELSAASDIAAESTRLYQLLQSNVDEQMQRTGFVPPGDYGMAPPAAGPAPETPNGVANWQPGPDWKCSAKQKELILKLVDEHQLDKNHVESLARERFGKGVRQLNKVEASGLIDELLATHGAGTSGEQGRPSAAGRSAYRSRERRAA